MVPFGRTTAGVQIIRRLAIVKVFNDDSSSLLAHAFLFVVVKGIKATVVRGGGGGFFDGVAIIIVQSVERGLVIEKGIVFTDVEIHVGNSACLAICTDRVTAVAATFGSSFGAIMIGSTSAINVAIAG